MQPEHWSTIVANIVTSLGILSFLGFYFAHRQTQNQFKFTVMISCIERFQQLFPIIRNDAEDISRLIKYVNLTNEEFFYFQRGYIPKEVIVEWMDSIVEYFPIYVSGSELPINHDRILFKQIHEDKLLDDYPRLKKAFTLTVGQEISMPRDKIKLIKEIAVNLEISLSNKHFKRAMVN